MQDPGDASTSREPHFLRRRVDEVVLVLQVDGELDIKSTDSLRSALDEAEREGDIVRIDAAGVSFVDSTALGVLLASAQRLSARGGRLELINVSPPVRRILDMTLIARTVHVIS
jgi:anti-sigma B factor antagonist